MKIILVGYMGSGKTTVGRLLAQKLNMDFLDLDDYIESKLNLKISSIFEEKGEIYFRKKEHELLNVLLTTKDNLVLTTGGGTPCYAGNMTIILDSTDYVFYLKVSIPELAQRLYREKEHRPLIKHLSPENFPEFIGKHLFERSPFYNMATYTITCDKKSPKEIADEIKGLLV